MKSVLSNMALLASLAMAFSSIVGCSNVADNSLLTDQENDSSSHTVNKDPLSTEVFIAVDSSSLVMPTSTSSVEVTGSCYTSTYPDNNVQVFNSVGAAVAAMDLKTGSYNPKCRDGRFAIIISPGSLATGTNDLKIQLPVLDSSNKTTLNQANAVRYFSVTKP
ncbi:hypothetical protein [Bdellovibrio svalbardensis]|uniref:Lipoprotein n=1 Tax=Bdellovibrio svalbardensis TaxID=2972972 RepID=A0ABT6DIE7_9BACT|nr:hypothetical protein [Bdellovibrio svalbardensis]MDG0816623.1 hypothetical protein [Bdellovibrio svalbardensis]